MAKVNGFELKGIKEFKGHEGEPCFQGNIYLNGKKVGWFTDDSWGGCKRIDFEDSELHYFFANIAKRYAEAYPDLFTGIGIELTRENQSTADWFDEEWFIIELMILKENETLMKKYMKKGAASMVFLFNTEGLDEGVYSDERAFYRVFKSPKTEADISLPPNCKLLKIINSLDEFNITV